MNLKEIYFQLMQNLHFNLIEIEDLWLDLEKSYTSKSRYYHNLNHLQEMIFLFEKYKNNLQFPDEVLMAIFYHDFIYKVTRKDNELKSAEHILAILPKECNLNKDLIFELICATKLHQHNENEDINWLIDFDLKILSNNWNAYKIYYEQIRKEYKIYPDFLYKAGRKKALEHFLKNEFIFQTQEFRTLFEDKARENIQKEIATL